MLKITFFFTSDWQLVVVAVAVAAAVAVVVVH